MSLEQTIKDEARRLGFALAGITTPDPPPHWQAYEAWLARGWHASMSYLQDPRRADPRLVFPECRSILVLGLQYPNPGPWDPQNSSHKTGGQQSRGTIAAYARGTDYHLFIPERLNTLHEIIESNVEVQVLYRAYTDSGPLLERDLAQRAGLGWIGKNTCLINPRNGSYFLLAELMLSIYLEPDPPFIFDRCGKCTRCMAACPTQCIAGDRTIDARRCLSYQTIENKGEIPPELHSSLGNLIFGCDICQQVCPWNRFAEDTQDPVFDAGSGKFDPILAEELTLSPEDFTRKFKDTPVLRAKRQGYLRNVAIALANSKAS